MTIPELKTILKFLSDNGFKIKTIEINGDLFVYENNSLYKTIQIKQEITGSIF